MRRRVTTAPKAVRALAQARQWLLQPGSGANGRQRWEALRDARRKLLIYPYLGAISRDHEGHYQLTVSGYRLLYTIDPDTGYGATAGDVRIVAVFGPGLP